MERELKRVPDDFEEPGEPYEMPEKDKYFMVAVLSFFFLLFIITLIILICWKACKEDKAEAE